MNHKLLHTWLCMCVTPTPPPSSLPPQPPVCTQVMGALCVAASADSLIDFVTPPFPPSTPVCTQVMGALCVAARRAVLEADPRLVEALYLCQVQAAAEALSGVYAVLGRRRARILQVGGGSVCGCVGVWV